MHWHLQQQQLLTKRLVCLIWYAIHPGKEILLLSQHLQLQLQTQMLRP